MDVLKSGTWSVVQIVGGVRATSAGPLPRSPVSLPPVQTSPGSGADRGPGRFPLRAGTGGRASTSTIDLCVSFPPLLDDAVPPHTLILGTLPSVNSFDRCEYYATPSNAFWWIVGDALGHRRAPPAGGWRDSRGRATSVPRFISENLLHVTPALSYADAHRALTASGFAVWDVLSEAEREGSTDPKIRGASERANDVAAFLRERPTIRRICFSSGQGTAARFVKTNRAWLGTPGAFMLVDSPATHRVFGRIVPPPPPAAGAQQRPPPIELAVMLSVSGAFVAPWKGRGERIYVEKRDDWFRHCFRRESLLSPLLLPVSAGVSDTVSGTEVGEVL